MHQSPLKCNEIVDEASVVFDGRWRLVYVLNQRTKALSLTTMGEIGRAISNRRPVFGIFQNESKLF